MNRWTVAVLWLLLFFVSNARCQTNPLACLSLSDPVEQARCSRAVLESRSSEGTELKRIEAERRAAEEEARRTVELYQDFALKVNGFILELQEKGTANQKKGKAVVDAWKKLEDSGFFLAKRN